MSLYCSATLIGIRLATGYVGIGTKNDGAPRSVIRCSRAGCGGRLGRVHADITHISVLKAMSKLNTDMLHVSVDTNLVMFLIT